jgi:putative two-component system response regulator
MSRPDAAALLVVDDEPYVREIVTRWLTRAGYACDAAADVTDALALLSVNPYALVLSDVNMPGRSGLELLRTVRRQFPGTAVVMATALTDQATALGALKQGAYGYVLKPLDRNATLIEVANALERRRLNLEHEAYERRLAEAVRERTAEVRRREQEIILRLGAATKSRHEETGAHLRRIGAFAARLAEELGWQPTAVDDLRVAAPLHDVGKIGVPDEVLLKPGRLTEEEFRIVRSHTLVGAEILGGSEVPLLEMAADIALCHHENWDGRGYPNGLAGEHIPEAARIVALVDVYDALVNDRVYRPALPQGEALGVMVDMAASRFDPLMFECFTGLLPQLARILAEYSEKQLELPQVPTLSSRSA